LKYDPGGKFISMIIEITLRDVSPVAAYAFGEPSWALGGLSMQA
jgi:hypothetical protein